jgi:hypothetical protein
VSTFRGIKLTCRSASVDHMEALPGLLDVEGRVRLMYHCRDKFHGSVHLDKGQARELGQRLLEWAGGGTTPDRGWENIP